MDIDNTSPDELKWGYVPLMLSSIDLRHKALDNKKFTKEYMFLTDMVNNTIGKTLKFNNVFPTIVN